MTIKRVLKEDEITEYELTIPNKEVKISLSKYIINKYLNDDYPDEKIKPIRKALKKADFRGTQEHNLYQYLPRYLTQNQNT